jgi:hypothetical protein
VSLNITPCGRIVVNELEMVDKSILISFDAGICLERLKEITIDVIRVSRSPSRDLNPVPVEYKEGVVPNVLRCTVKVSGSTGVRRKQQEVKSGRIQNVYGVTEMKSQA